MSEFKIQKAEGRYKLEDMQKRASVASTADGLTLEGPNFKLGCLTACPDMLLFACEELAKANERVKELEKAKHKDSLETISDYILEFMQVNEIKNFKNVFLTIDTPLSLNGTPNINVIVNVNANFNLRFD